MKITLLMPVYNEGKSLEKSLDAIFSQTRSIDEVIIVNDGSNDKTKIILNRYGKTHQTLLSIHLSHNTGNKSRAQEKGIPYITGDIVIMTDGDTILHRDFTKKIEEKFLEDTRGKIGAVIGYVKSIPYNWLTICRQIDYVIGQDIFKRAQSIIGYVYVMPGCATALRYSVLKKLHFSHETVTEDLDFTFQVHRQGYRIAYATEAIVYTQDPPTLVSYIRQMSRWYSGAWQNMKKHWKIMLSRPASAFVLTSMFADGVIYSAIALFGPILAPRFFFLVLIPSYFVISIILSMYASLRSKRPELFLYFPHFVFLIWVNAYVLIKTFIWEMIFQRKDTHWHRPERIHLGTK